MTGAPGGMLKNSDRRGAPDRTGSFILDAADYQPGARNEYLGGIGSSRRLDNPV
jgi:hypothetical protein